MLRGPTLPPLIKLANERSLWLDKKIQVSHCKRKKNAREVIILDNLAIKAALPQKTDKTDARVAAHGKYDDSCSAACQKVPQNT